MVSYWPLFDLELRTPRLILRPPRDDDFPALIDAIDSGIHDPEVMPFSHPWTDADPVSLRRGAAQFWWRARASWSPDDWHLPLAVLHDGRPVGVQELFATQFPVLREVGTGSWLTRRLQRQGLGREMRAAVLQLAFDGLGAVVARSGAFVDNPASAAVSRALGYRENGRRREAPRGEPRDMVNFELTREDWVWRSRMLPRADIVGLEEALPMFWVTRLHGEVASCADPSEQITP
jgi:RimJ/RimL family protein N-acetyltransferase